MIPLGHARPKSGLAYRMEQDSLSATHHNPKNSIPLAFSSTLQEACRSVIVANLERYPPESLGVLEEQEWNLLITYRHEKTKPKKTSSTNPGHGGGGGLDGTGRLTPALSDKFLAAVEKVHPDEKVRESTVADTLLWKDCVNFSFRRGGLTRPRVLEYPWPLLVQRLERAVETTATLLPATLVDPAASTTVDHSEETAELTSETMSAIHDLDASLTVLEESPISVQLLVDTGAGKILKKSLKKHNPQESHVPGGMERLERLLDSWKQVAQREGVQLQQQSPTPKTPSSKKAKMVSGTASATKHATTDASSTWRTRMPRKIGPWHNPVIAGVNCLPF